MTTPTTTVAVMAGGRGLRLWPRSTAHSPKQFHGFFGGPVLLCQCLALAGLIVPPERIYVVTAMEFTERCRAIAGAKVRLLAEPTGRDTAACVGIAALHAEAEHPGAVLALLPSDHWVGDYGAFAETMREAVDLAGREQRLVTVGVKPDRAETGYGYITVAGRRGVRFHEKPGAREAARLIAGGNVLWNAGIFVAQASVFLHLISRYLPALGAALDRIRAALGTEEEARVLAAVYAALPSISFDHGVAERLDDFLVVPAAFPWDDLGSWSAFARLLPTDSVGNITAGQVHAYDSVRCLADTPGLQTVLLGVADLVVIREGDCLLVASVDRAQEVKQVGAEFGFAAVRETEGGT